MVDGETGPFKRALRIGKLSAGIAGSYLGYQLQNLYLDRETSRQKRAGVNQRTSAKVREELQQLRGPVMKLGQVLSMQNDALPPEIIDELTSLQMEAPPMHPTLMRVQCRKALGKNPEEIFKEFDPKPFAAASLGQVHRATTKRGEQVAVKIQYPAIREVIENDFKLLRAISVPAKLAGYLPKIALDELERGILEETDYVNEAKNMDLFRQGLKALPYARVPVLHPRLCTDTVLTMSLLNGVHLAEFLRTKPSQALRNKIGARLIELFCTQLHGVHAVHADPHPGNYLFTKDGDIALLDFGCVKKLGSNTIGLLRQLATRAYHAETDVGEIIQRVFGRMGKVNHTNAREVITQVVRLYEAIYPEDHTARDSIDFGKPKTMEMLRTLWQNAFRSKLLSPDYLFTSRAEMGLVNVLYTLKAKVATTHTLKRVLKRVYP